MTSIGFLFNFLAKVDNVTRRLLGNIFIQVGQEIPLHTFLADACAYQEVASGNMLYGTIVFRSNMSVWYTTETDVIRKLKLLKREDFHRIGTAGLTDYLRVTPDTKGFFTPDAGRLHFFYDEGVDTVEDWDTTAIQDIVHSKNGPIIDYERVLVTAFYEKGIMEKLHNHFKPKDIVT